MLVRSSALRGFTVLELAISMAIAGIVIAAASTAAVNVTRVLKLEAKKSVADQDARRLVDFVVGRMQVAGGGPVRPWMAMWHEENCAARNGLPACGDSDHLTIVDVDPFRGPCQIESVSLGEISFARTTPTDPCCYAWPPEATDIDDNEPNQFHATSLMLVNGRNKWMMVRTTLETDESTCTLALDDDFALEGWDAAVKSADIDELAGGQAVAASTRTLFLGKTKVAGAVLSSAAFGGDDPPPPVEGAPLLLLEWFDDNYDADVDDKEVRVVFPGVYDFQIALGYDASPEDGKVVESVVGNDEWWGNRAESGALTMDLGTLRMGAVGVIVGVKAVDPGVRTLAVLNGVPITRSHHLMRSATGRSLLRNIAVFY